MPAPTPFKDPDTGKAATPTFNEKLALKALLKQTGQGKALVPNLELEPAKVRKFTRDELKASVQRISQRVFDYVEQDNRLEQRLEHASLKDITVMMGILTDKMQLLEGQPTQILGHQQQAKMDEVGQKLQELLKQRGLGQKVTLTERTATIEAK
jgi:transposase